jgi:hypothetical protein
MLICDYHDESSSGISASRAYLRRGDLPCGRVERNTTDITGRSTEPDLLWPLLLSLFCSLFASLLPECLLTTLRPEGCILEVCRRLGQTESCLLRASAGPHGTSLRRCVFPSIYSPSWAGNVHFGARSGGWDSVSSVHLHSDYHLVQSSESLPTDKSQVDRSHLALSDLNGCESETSLAASSSARMHSCRDARCPTHALNRS